MALLCNAFYYPSCCCGAGDASSGCFIALYFPRLKINTPFPASVVFLFFYPAVLTTAVLATLWIFPWPLEIIN